MNMPRLRLHMKYSKKRTGNDYRKLHEWMDAPQKELGINHRTERHDTGYIPFIKKEYGREGVYEFLMHIAADYKSTARKWKKKAEVLKPNKQENSEKHIDKFLADAGCPKCGCKSFYTGQEKGELMCADCELIFRLD